jgi:hypothetical protein
MRRQRQKDKGKREEAAGERLLPSAFFLFPFAFSSGTSSMALC